MLALEGPFVSSESLEYISLTGSNEELSLLEGLELLERAGLVDEDGAPEVALRDFLAGGSASWTGARFLEEEIGAVSGRCVLLRRMPGWERKQQASSCSKWINRRLPHEKYENEKCCGRAKRVV